MKKLIVGIVLLFFAIVTMAYLYFSRLHTDQHTTDIGLQAAVANTGFIFAFENEKGITDILKEQQLFQEILGTDKYKQLSALKKHLLALPRMQQLAYQQNIYIGFVPDGNRDIDFLCITQISNQQDIPLMLHSLKAGGIGITNLNKLIKLTLADSNVFYLGIKENLAVLSASEKQTAAALAKVADKKDEQFMEYILASKRFSKNSLAQLYINYNSIPGLLKNIIAGKLTGELAVFDQQDAFAALTYNFSKEKVLLTGTTLPNNPNSYYHLFSSLEPQKISISNILPDNTSTYTVYAIDNYTNWKKNLDNWFLNQHEDKKIADRLAGINSKYHLNLDELFPRYFKNQLLTFQLSTAEKIGAVNLSNGDKMMQLLLDLSEDYNEEIKVLKEADLLYAYFGLPFKDFKRPFYVIRDNYMVFSNYASTLQSFLNSYNNNKLLINSANYSSANNQLPGNSSITYYLDHRNATDIFRKNIFSPYYQHISAAEGLKKYDTFIYQLSGDKGKFQTNVFINKQAEVLQKDSLAL
jgi:hypothetical protein